MTDRTHSENCRLAVLVGANHYSQPPMRAVSGYSFTYEQLDKFVEAIRADEREKMPTRYPNRK